MPDEAAFRLLVRDALAHLYEPAYLAVHQLNDLLRESGLVQTPDGLFGFLATAVEQLRPSVGAPPASAGWRRYRYLRLRYVEGATHRRIASDLLISTRQATREHEAGLEAIAGVLWAQQVAASRKHQTALAPNEPLPTPITQRSVSISQTPNLQTPTAQRYGAASAEVELLRLGSAPPDELTNLEEVTLGALATSSRLAADRRVTLRADLASDLPPVIADRLALRHILLNLLGYAIDVTQEGTIVVASRAGEETVDLILTSEPASAFSDEGASVGESHAGLITARRMAEMQGLQLDVEKTPEATLRAVLSLPATRATTILLVDDSPDIGRLFRRYLAGTGYCLIHTRSAEKALRLVREAHPSLIVLDILLPGDDGWQFLETLRDSETIPDVPVVVCSVVPEQSLAESLEVVEFLTKPVSQQALLSALARWCPVVRSAEHPGSPSSFAQAPRQ